VTTRRHPGFVGALLASTHRDGERKRRTRAQLTLYPDPPNVTGRTLV